MLHPTAHESQVVVVHVSGFATHLFGCSISAAVGQTSMQAPLKSQLLSSIDPPAPNAICRSKPRPPSVIALVCRLSSQTRWQRVQMMHICGSNSMYGFARSAGGCGAW